MRFRAGQRTVVVDVPHFLFLTGLVGFCTWYFLDAHAASNTLENLLLIEPAVIAALVLYVLILRDVVRVVPNPAASPDASLGGIPAAVPAPRPPLSRIVRIRIFGGMALLVAYVALMGTIGFDVATALYVAATLALLGERRPLVLVLLPLLFAAVVVYAFRQMVTVPVPTLLELIT